MMLLYSKIMQIKYFVTPPPQTKRRKDTNGPDIATCLYKQLVTWIFTRLRLNDSAQSDPFIKNYYLIIVTFSRPHFSIYDIFYTKESTLRFHARVTHFNRFKYLEILTEPK